MDSSRIQHTAAYHPARIRGVTLTELLVALAVIAILVSMSLPSLNDLALTHHRTGRVNSLIGDLYFARAEALRTNNWVVMCKSPDGQFCSNTADWEEGWIIFADTNQDRRRNPGEALLYSNPGNQDITIRYSAFPSNNYVIYYPNGSSLGNGTFTFCDRRGAAHARAVILAKTGRPRSSDTAADGSALSCTG